MVGSWDKGLDSGRRSAAEGAFFSERGVRLWSLEGLCVVGTPDLPAQPPSNLF